MTNEQYAIMPLSDYEDTCDSIRAKTGGSALIKSGDMASEIDSIQTGGGDPYELARAIANASITEYVDDSLKYLKNSAFNSCSNLTRLIVHNVTGISGNAIYGTAIEALALPNAVSIAYGGLGNATKLKSMDFSKIQALGSNALQMCSSLNTVVLRRKTGITSLAAISVFYKTPLGSDGSGGTLYVPNELIDSYKSATNWSTILSYPNNQILPIEGSIYETQYADGTPIPTE